METTDYIWMIYKYDGELKLEPWCILNKTYTENGWEYSIYPSFTVKNSHVGYNSITVINDFIIAHSCFCFSFSAKCTILKYIMQESNEIIYDNYEIEKHFYNIKEAKKLLERYI